MPRVCTSLVCPESVPASKESEGWGSVLSSPWKREKGKSGEITKTHPQNLYQPLHCLCTGLGDGQIIFSSSNLTRVGTGVPWPCGEDSDVWRAVAWGGGLIMGGGLAALAAAYGSDGSGSNVE